MLALKSFYVRCSRTAHKIYQYIPMHISIQTESTTHKPMKKEAWNVS